MKLLHHGAQDRLIGSGEQERGTIENGDLKDQFIRLPWTIASVKCNLERILFIKPRYKIVWLCQIPFPRTIRNLLPLYRWKRFEGVRWNVHLSIPVLEK